MFKRKSVTTFLTILALVFFGVVSRAHALTLTPVRLELSGDPGATVDGEITLINDRDTQETFYSSFANFEAQGETGSPNFVDPVEGLGTWMTTDTSVVLAPNTSKIVPVSINIPTNAEPGGYFAAVFFGTNNPNTGGAGTVAIGAKTGVLVLLKVNGLVDEKGGILEYGTKNSDKFFTSLPVSFFYRFQNTGGDRIKPEGNITIKHFLGFTKAVVPANIIEGNVLPNQIRRFEVTWQSKNGSSVQPEKMNFLNTVKYQWRNFAFGYYKADLLLSYGENKQNTSGSTGFWVIPWQLLITLIVLAFVIFTAWKKYSKHRRSSLMNEVREELMKEMTDKSTGDKNHIQF